MVVTSTQADAPSVAQIQGPAVANSVAARLFPPPGTPGAGQLYSQAVVDAVALGGVITFSCGPDPVTIVMTTTAKVVNTSPIVVLDGGGEVTLNGAGQRRILYMNTCDQAQIWTTSRCQSQDQAARCQASACRGRSTTACSPTTARLASGPTGHAWARREAAMAARSAWTATGTRWIWLAASCATTLATRAEGPSSSSRTTAPASYASPNRRSRTTQPRFRDRRLPRHLLPGQGRATGDDLDHRVT